MMFPVRSDDLAAIGVRPEEIKRYLDPLNAAMGAYEITTGERPAMFVAQVAHESGLFRYVSELWGPTPQQKRYSDGGELSKKLGNIRPSDGFDYRGHGLVQVTGRANHAEIARAMCIWFDEIVPWLCSPVGATRSAAYFWKSRGCNELADAFDFVGVTKKINGGINGLAERSRLYSILSRRGVRNAC